MKKPKRHPPFSRPKVLASSVGDSDEKNDGFIIYVRQEWKDGRF
jgi:hypothetical protein